MREEHFFPKVALAATRNHRRGNSGQIREMRVLRAGEDERNQRGTARFDGDAELAGKLDSYARLAEVMSRYHQQLPLLLFCFLTPRRERTARRALAASTDSLSLRIATAAIDPQVTCPAGQVWMPLHGSGRQVRLIDLGRAIPDRGHLARARGDPYR